MEKANLGTENIEKVLKGALELAIVAKQVMADGKIDSKDIAAGLALINKLKVLVDSAASAPKALDEIKDLDIAEIVALISKVSDMVKDVEKA